MNRGALCCAGVLLAAAVAFGCSRRVGDSHRGDHGHDHATPGSPADKKAATDHHAHGGHETSATGELAGGSGVVFQAGRGLTLNADARDALGLNTAVVEERLMNDNLRLLAQVFAVKPKVLASATVPADHQDHFTKHSFTDATLVRMDRTATGSARLVDLIVEVQRAPAPVVGDFIELDFGADPSRVLAAPRSALLDAAAGAFVYVVQGDAYRRTPVKIGARSADFVEIVEGLHAGDVVVSTAVKQLWLAELRLTKGGGHSH